MNHRKTLLIILSRAGLVAPAISIFQYYSRSMNRLKGYVEGDFVIWKSKSYKNTILVDISSLVAFDHGGGIQRVQRSLIENWCSHPPENLEVYPIYFCEEISRFLYVKPGQLSSWNPFRRVRTGVVEMARGDIYLNTDLNYRFAIEYGDFYRVLEEHGIRIYFITYDLLPLSLPLFFPSGISELHQKWFEVGVCHSKLLCISKTVVNEAVQWATNNRLSVRATSINLGSDLSKTFLDSNRSVNRMLDDQKFKFMIVSTIEVRKGHVQVLDALEILWERGLDVTLTFVGRAGWKVDELLDRIENHQYVNNKLFWFSNLDDQGLEKVYKDCTALINASYGEGFGLPLVEAAAYGLPLILRDIPIFREIAGDKPWYFSSTSPLELAELMESWMGEYARGNIEQNPDIKIVSWQETCEQITEIFRCDAEREGGEI